MRSTELFFIGILLVLVTSGCEASPPEQPYKRGKDFDPGNLTHLMYHYNVATKEQKEIANKDSSMLNQLNKDKKWTGLFKTALALIGAFPTPDAVVHLGDAFLNTPVSGKDKQELIKRKKSNIKQASAYYSAALEFSKKVGMPFKNIGISATVKKECSNEYVNSGEFTDTNKCQFLIEILKHEKII